jgi:hypothetical protein
MKLVVLARATSVAIKPMKYHDHLRYVFGTGPTSKSAMDVFSRVNFEKQLAYHDHLRFVFGIGPNSKSAMDVFIRVNFEKQLAQRICFLSAPR